MRNSRGAQVLRQIIASRGWGAVRAITRELGGNPERDAGKISRWAAGDVVPEYEGRRGMSEKLGIDMDLWDVPALPEEPKSSPSNPPEVKGSAA